MEMNVDKYFDKGCGRCALAATPQCKVNNWLHEMKILRNLLLNCNLTEEIKWGVPCYTFNKKNIVIMAALKNYCALSFLKGALLTDEHNILQNAGENSQSVRLIKFYNILKINELLPILKAYVFEAIEIEKIGQKIELKKITEYNIVEEFKIKLNQNPQLQNAFKLLTPGRQRAYLLYFSSAKQSATRIDRIEKSIPTILLGKGIYD